MILPGSLYTLTAMKLIFSSEFLLPSLLAILGALACSNCSSYDVSLEWCQVLKSYDAYDVVLRMMNASKIREKEVDWLINTTFARAGCTSQLLNSSLSADLICAQCLGSEKIYQAIRLPAGAALNETEFSQFSLILLTFISDLPHWCLKGPGIDWSNVTHEYFVHELLALGNSYPAVGHSEEEDHDHENEKEEDEDHHGHHFQIGQLEYLLRHIAETVLPGSNPYLGYSGAEKADFIEYICSNQNIRSFSSREISQLINLSNPVEGIDEEDMSRMSGILITKLISGECIRNVEEGAAVESEEFMRSLFLEYSDPGTCHITYEGLERMAVTLNIGGLDEHDHESEDDHDHDNGDDHDHDNGDDHDHDNEDDHDSAGGASDGNVTDSHSHEDDNHSTTADGLDNVTSSVIHDGGGSVNDDNMTLSRTEGKQRRRKRETHDHDLEEHQLNQTDLNKTCYSITEILRSISLDAENLILTRTDMFRLCPVLLHQAVLGCPNSRSDPVPVTEESTTAAQAYGYGTIAVIVVSSCSLFGLVIVRWQHTAAYRYIMTLMLGLGVASLVGDALLHLIPHALGLHDHESDEDHGHDHESGSVTVEPFIWKVLCACGSIWFYYNLQLLLQLMGELIESRQKSDPCLSMVVLDHIGSQSSTTTLTHSHNNYQTSYLEDKDGKKYKIQNDNDDIVTTTSQQKENPTEVNHGHPTAAWMITFGDAVHNFADGLAMGAAFSRSWKSGLSLTIAVFVHELPHEFGDIAIMLSAGWSVRKVIICQLLSQATAFVGLYIGIGISSNSTEAQLWIFSVTCGLFLYVSLANIVPELVEYFSHYNRVLVFITSNIGLAIGFAAMLLLAIYEEQIAIN